MKFLPISSMFSQILLRLCNCKHKSRSFRGRTSILLTGSNVKQSNFCRLNRSASALGAQNMDVESRSAPTLPVKPTRRSTQVGLFQSQQGSSSFCLHNSLIKTGLSLYLHVTFSLKETFRIDGVYAVWVLKGTQNWQCDLFFSFVLSMVLSVQVTAAPLLTARFLHTPGGSFRSMWPNIQVLYVCCGQRRKKSV